VINMATTPTNANTFMELTAEASTLISIPLLQQFNPMQLEYKPSLQSDSSPLACPIPRPTLIARWEIENNKLVCRWVIDDRPFDSSSVSKSWANFIPPKENNSSTQSSISNH
jgi:hypothetical protein